MLTNENVKKNKGVGVARERPPNSAIQARCLCAVLACGQVGRCSGADEHSQDDQKIKTGEDRNIQQIPGNEFCFKTSLFQPARFYLRMKLNKQNLKRNPSIPFVNSPLPQATRPLRSAVPFREPVVPVHCRRHRLRTLGERPETTPSHTPKEITPAPGNPSEFPAGKEIHKRKFCFRVRALPVW